MLDADFDETLGLPNDWNIQHAESSGRNGLEFVFHTDCCSLTDAFPVVKDGHISHCNVAPMASRRSGLLEYIRTP